MDRRPVIHTTKRDLRWVNILEGSDEILGDFDIRAEAVEAARELARADRAEHVTHRPDGTIEDFTVSG